MTRVAFPYSRRIGQTGLTSQTPGLGQRGREFTSRRTLINNSARYLFNEARVNYATFSKSP